MVCMLGLRGDFRAGDELRELNTTRPRVDDTMLVSDRRRPLWETGGERGPRVCSPQEAKERVLFPEQGA